MTIRRGEPWGQQVTPPADLHVVAGDAELHDWVVKHREAGVAIPPVGVRSGDLARTLGGGHGAFEGEVTRAPIDIVRVVAGERTTWSVAHVELRRGRLRLPALVAMNAQFLRAYDLAPRGHPNDGRVDVTRFDRAIGLRVGRQVRARARTGTHVPHPLITVSQSEHVVVDLPRPLRIRVDGRPFGRGAHLDMTVEPDAFTLYA